MNAKKHGSEESSCCLGIKPGARQRVIDAACSLFYRKGIRAVGVESIAEEADTTKMSLYRYFPSKDELVAEWLRRAHEAYMVWWDAQIQPYAGNPRRQLMELVARHSERMAEPEARGCAVANAAVEITDPDHPAREVIEQHKAQVRERLLALCSALDVHDPRGLSDGLFLLLEGARASVQSLGCEGPCGAFAQTAEALVAAYESHPQKRVGKARIKV